VEFYEAISKRRTIRAFKPTAVEEDKVRRVLEAGLKAPCNAHLKDWQFIFLRDAENRRRALADALKARDLKDPRNIEDLVNAMPQEELRRVYRKSLPVQLTMMLEAPELLIVLYRIRKPLGEVRTLFELNNLASVWCCVENIMLALAAEGLYGCTYSPYDTSGLKQYLGVPGDMEVATIIPFGYPKEQPHEAASEDLERRLHIDKW
jgi:nitroreductase